MADDFSNPPNPVRVALDCAAISWRELTDDQRSIFIRTLMGRVCYDGRTAKVTLQFDDRRSTETAKDDAAAQIEGEIEGEINES